MNRDGSTVDYLPAFALKEVDLPGIEGLPEGVWVSEDVSEEGSEVCVSMLLLREHFLRNHLLLGSFGAWNALHSVRDFAIIWWEKALILDTIVGKGLVPAAVESF